MEIGAEAAQFPEKEYINGIFLAVCLVYLYSFLNLVASMQKLSLKKTKSQGRCHEKEEAERSNTFVLPPSLPEALQVASQVGPRLVGLQNELDSIEK